MFEQSLYTDKSIEEMSRMNSEKPSVPLKPKLKIKSKTSELNKLGKNGKSKLALESEYQNTPQRNEVKAKFENYE